MSADRPTAHQPLGEIGAVQWQMDYHLRSSAQTKSKPVTDSALEGSWLLTKRSPISSLVWLVHRCFNSIHGGKFALVSDAALECAVI
jgi:hypothetical protein